MKVDDDIIMTNDDVIVQVQRSHKPWNAFRRIIDWFSPELRFRTTYSNYGMLMTSSFVIFPSKFPFPSPSPPSFSFSSFLLLLPSSPLMLLLSFSFEISLFLSLSLSPGRCLIFLCLDFLELRKTSMSSTLDRFSQWKITRRQQQPNKK